MARRSVIAAQLLLLLAAAPPTRAQEPTPQPSPAAAEPGEPAAAEPVPAPVPQETPPQTLADRIAEAWRAPEVSLEGRVSAVRTLRDENGLNGVPKVANALVVEGFRSLAAGNGEEALARFEAARNLDPTAASPRLGLAKAETAGQPITLAAASDLSRVARLRWTSPRSSPFAGANWIMAVAFALGAAAILALLALMVRKQRLLRHDLEEGLKRRFDGEVGAVIAWVLLLLPLLLTFDLYWAALYWALLVWAYLDGPEQAVLILSVLWLALVVPAAGLAARLVQNAADPAITAAVHYLDGVVDDHDRAALTTYAAAHPEDGGAGILVALVEERDGAPRKAIATYRQIAERSPSALVYNNLANVYYRLDEKDRAFEFWKKALDLEPTLALAHYNLSLYYFGMFDFGKKDEHFAKAKEIDARAVDRWQNAGPGVVDAGPDRSELMRRLWTEERQGEPPALKAALTAPHTLAAAAVLVLGFGYARKRRIEGVATGCVKCGAAFCNRCKSGKEREDYCLQCVHMFIRKDGVSPQMRADKVKEIGRNQLLRKAISSLLSLVAPGAGAIYREQPLLGLVLVVIWCLALAAFFAVRLGLSEPGLVAEAAKVMPAWLALIPAAAVWVMGNLGNALRKD